MSLRKEIIKLFLFNFEKIFLTSVNTPFEWTILTTILCTTVVLALEEHLPNGDKTPLSESLVNIYIYFFK